MKLLKGPMIFLNQMMLITSQVNKMYRAHKPISCLSSATDLIVYILHGKYWVGVGWVGL